MIYDDDHFHPDNADAKDDYDEELKSYLIQTESVATDDLDPNRRKQRKLMEDYKLSDKGFRYLYRMSNGKKKKIGVYVSSYKPGFTIRDAVTGVYQNGNIVGSLDEDFYFKVKFATGELGTDPVNLFFESPAQFIKHTGMSVSDDTIKRWQSKYFNSIRELNAKPVDTMQYIIVK